MSNADGWVAGWLVDRQTCSKQLEQALSRHCSSTQPTRRVCPLFGSPPGSSAPCGREEMCRRMDRCEDLSISPSWSVAELSGAPPDPHGHRIQWEPPPCPSRVPISRPSPNSPNHLGPWEPDSARSSPTRSGACEGVCPDRRAFAMDPVSPGDGAAYPCPGSGFVLGSRDSPRAGAGAPANPPPKPLLLPEAPAAGFL
ncbi:unnamed protein product [Caretta caretta]